MPPIHTRFQFKIETCTKQTPLKYSRAPLVHLLAMRNLSQTALAHSAGLVRFGRISAMNSYMNGPFQSDSTGIFGISVTAMKCGGSMPG